MTALIHVLGSDIPHHNQTVLRFFNDELAADPQARRFLVVGDEASVRDGYPALDITCYPGKKALAQLSMQLVLKQKIAQYLLKSRRIQTCLPQKDWKAGH